MPPRVIGPYRIIETLGSGGVGTVYRAIDRRTGESAALKLLSTGGALNPRAARRLAREFETLQDLSHPNVVKVYDTGVYQGYPYLAMELVEGLTLRQYLALYDEELASDAGLARAIHKQRLSMNNPVPDNIGDTDETNDDLKAPARDHASDGVGHRAQDDDSDDGSDSETGRNIFSLSNYAEEMASEELMVDDFEEGPDSVRRLADMVDEPDTNVTMSGELVLPFDIPAPEKKPPPAKLSATELDHLNRPERMGRLKDAMLQVCKALAYIHQHGLIHRDLKPSNIMVDEDRQVRLMDFGLAKYLADDAAVTADGRLVGTFRYMAPEQILGESLDARTDLYSLGVILYELLAGRPPFEAKTPYELWQKVLETDAPPIPSLNSKSDRTLARVAHRLLRKEPNDRYQTAEEVYDALIE